MFGYVLTEVDGPNRAATFKVRRWIGGRLRQAGRGRETGQFFLKPRPGWPVVCVCVCLQSVDDGSELCMR